MVEGDLGDRIMMGTVMKRVPFLCFSVFCFRFCFMIYLYGFR